MDPKRISSPNPVPSEEAHHFYHRCHFAFSITINLDSTGSQISPENSIGVARNSEKLVQEVQQRVITFIYQIENYVNFLCIII
ncbi:hypothetical protein P8452_39011 [Trifolium repens]|nr:hypothetical protein P8452_39011 [Trifolium repens]